MNNAGVFKTGDMEAETVEGWEFVMDINVKGVRPAPTPVLLALLLRLTCTLFQVFLGMKHGSEAMKALGTPEKDRSIVNISSVAGMMGTAGAFAYGASKWAVRGMTKSGAEGLGPHGIRCNSVHPGLISTRMLHDVRSPALCPGLPVLGLALRH